ncbi:PLP-dependent aminotransferase family protein [Paenibacillus humicola]|uniref:MocR-like pyridoxine biosynthesis transcription factor PdxR n=1 Tax=Paenibacillus humicola TaxID=3110540 RepID=UPI00237B149A|nr:PLP-dependent aminotransferase family protein [Paenibacillus humicola]
MPPQLNRGANEPEYVRIYRFYRERILLGVIPGGTKLPSIRALAQHLGVSRNPVETAYAQLVAEGYLQNKPKSGYTAAVIEPLRGIAGPEPAVNQNLDHNANPKPGAGQQQEPLLIDFSYDRILPEHFPLRLWKRFMVKALNGNGRDLFGYGDPKGEPGLRRLIRSHLRQNRGVVCEPEQIVITSGTQQSAYMIGCLLSSENRELGVEAFMHPGMHRMFLRQRFVPVPIRLENDGLSCEELERHRQLCGVYVTPSHQFPQGAMLPAAKRSRLIHWAERCGGWIIEDDYDSEFVYEGRPLPALQSIDPLGRVIYLGTFSRILAPAIRLGFLILPPALLERYEREFNHFDQTASRLTQHTLQLLMEEGRLDRHIRRMRTFYQANRRVLIDAAATNFRDRVPVYRERSRGFTSSWSAVQAVRRTNWSVSPVCTKSKSLQSLVIWFRELLRKPILRWPGRDLLPGLAG